MAEMIDLWNISKQKIDDNLSNYSFNVVGEDGAGKTSFLYALMNRLAPTVTWGYEDRFKAVPNLRVVQMQNWSEHLAYVKQLKKGLKQRGALPFKNLIIDTVGEAYVMCQDKVMADNDWETMSGDHGGRYPVVGKAFMDSIRELKHMGLIVNFVSHDKDKTNVDLNGQEYTKAYPDTANQIKHLVMGGIDFIVYLEVALVEDELGETKEVRRLWIKGHPALKLKCPLYGLPKYIEYETVEEGVDKFIEAFNIGVRVTQEMADKGEDISNPNAENEVMPEFVEPTTGNTDVDEFEDEGGEDSSDLTLEELREMAVEIRTKLSKTMERSELIELLTDKLGIAAITKCTDIDKLKNFVESYK